MTHAHNTSRNDHVLVINPEGESSVVLVCEHASSFIPADLDDLGVASTDLHSHAVWDPGAMNVAKNLATHFGASLVASGVSRLVYDCNRPPTALDAMPEQSEAIAVPGNAHLTQEQRNARVQEYYEPFRIALEQTLAGKTDPILVTVHSFTPIYNGRERSVEIGILHDTDTRLADALLRTAPRHTAAVVERNAPYGPEHGVTHTLKEHALPSGRLNVMLEIRNDLITEAGQQDAMAKTIANWLSDSLASLKIEQAVRC